MMNFSKTHLRWPHFLYLLPLFFVLHGYLENYPVIAWTVGAWLLLKYLFVVLVLTGLFYFIIRSWIPTAVMVFCVMLFHLFFGPVHDGLKSLLPDFFLTKYSFILPAAFVCFLFLLFYLRKRKPRLPQLQQYLNFLLIVLIVIDLVLLVIKTTQPETSVKLAPAFTPCDTCQKPDVYLIIADAYTGREALEEVFHFDNSAFEQELQKRGFLIVDSSKSNYNYTPFTMAAMLGMQYLQGIKGHNGDLDDRNICFTLIDDNPVIDFFRSQGYLFKNYSIFQFAGKLPYRSTRFYYTGEEQLKAQTFVSRVNRDIRFNAVTRFKIPSEIERIYYWQLDLNQTLYQKTWEESSTPSEQPRFVYTHLEMPHSPYYFDKDGQPNALEDLTDERQVDTAKYIGYLQYSNKKYLELIDHIFAHAKQPPIILLMSDHAFREYANDAVDHRYHFMNLNTVFLPGKQYSGFYHGLSTVNQFRLLLNSAFGQKLPLLKDSTSYLVE